MAAKYRWVVKFANAPDMVLQSASGAQDAFTQATLQRPCMRITEIQKHPKAGNGFVYKSWKFGFPTRMR